MATALILGQNSSDTSKTKAMRLWHQNNQRAVTGVKSDEQPLFDYSFAATAAVVRFDWLFTRLLCQIFYCYDQMRQESTCGTPFRDHLLLEPITNEFFIKEDNLGSFPQL